MSVDTSTERADRTDRIERPAALRAVRAGVPWKTVLALAVVLAYADGFWLISLQGAVGAIERSQSPFTSWLQESTVLLPVFVIAVLGALTLSMRWFGPVLHRSRTIAATGLLVVAASTLVALAATVASAVYDYHLQSQQMQMMDSMRTSCLGGNCLDSERQATLALHVRSVLYISRWLLLTNVVLVAWLVAMWGGRFKLARLGPARAARPDRPPVTHSQPTTGDRDRDLRLLLVGALVAAAAIHAAVVPEHLSEWPAAGMFFVLLAVWELAVAGLLLARLEERTMLLAAAAVSAGPLLLWLWSRTAGLPFGPEPGHPEAVGLPDLAAGALEIAALVTALALLRHTGRLHRPALTPHQRGLAVAALLAVTAIGVAAVGLHGFDAFGVGDVASTMNMPH